MKGKISTTSKSPEQLMTQSLDQFFAENIKAAEAVDKHYAVLWQELNRLVRSGGKRMRPRITIMCYQAFGGSDVQSIISIATAQELLHQCLLIHDDIIDRDHKRYGVENISGRYKKLYKPYVKESLDLEHYSLSAALLAGDLLLSSAHQLIAESTIDPTIKQRVHAIFSQSIFNVAGGELLDTESAFRPVADISTKTIAKYKTASYSYVGPLLIGATLANADSASCAALRVFAEDLGIAFQLRDDILGVFGNEDTTGKSNETDIKEGKYTHLVECLLQKLDKKETAIFNTVFGNQSASAEQIQQIRDLFVSSGALEQVEEKIASYESSARKELDFLQLNNEYRELFEALINKSVRRDH